MKQIKASTDIGRVIGQYVSLQQKGGKLTGLCPFHDDHHPSLTVDCRRQTFTCFACGTYGDVFTFIQRIENCSFAEAVNRLSDGWKPPGGITKKKPIPVPQPPAGLPVSPAYHGVNDEFLRLLMPYIPTHPELTDTYLAFGTGVSPAVLPARWRKFAGRIIFPVRDDQGWLVGFAGRRQGEAEGSPKYINSSLNEGYRKGYTLYGLFRAKEAIRQTGEAVIVEGYKDALAMHAAGIVNTVALCGTALTDGQVALLKQYGTERACLLTDADDAGREAALKITGLLETHAMEAHTAALPEGDDPDSLFRRLGRESFAAYVRQFVPTPDLLGRMVTDGMRLLYENAGPDIQVCLDCEEKLQRLIRGLCIRMRQLPPSSIARNDLARMLSLRLEQYGYVSRALNRPGAV